MPKLFLIRAYQINVLNLVPALAFRIGGNNVHIPTTWNTQRGFFYMPSEDQTCDTVTSMVDLDKVELPNLELRNAFRYIPWSKNKSVLTELTSKDKFQILSTSVDSEVAFVKDFLKDDVVTVGVHYDKDDHDELVRNIARSHIYSMVMGWITPEDTICDEEEYIKRFPHLVKESTQASYDYDINFKDFTNKPLMMEHFKNIGLPFTEESEQFYDSWLANY